MGYMPLLSRAAIAGACALTLSLLPGVGNAASARGDSSCAMISTFSSASQSGTTCTVPSGVSRVDAFLIGAGGLGGLGTFSGGGGGGGGARIHCAEQLLRPGQPVTVTIGAGGSASSNTAGLTKLVVNGFKLAHADAGLQGSFAYDQGPGRGGLGGPGGFCAFPLLDTIIPGYRGEDGALGGPGGTGGMPGQTVPPSCANAGQGGQGGTGSPSGVGSRGADGKDGCIVLTFS